MDPDPDDVLAVLGVQQADMMEQLRAPAAIVVVERTENPGVIFSCSSCTFRAGTLI